MDSGESRLEWQDKGIRVLVCSLVISWIMWIVGCMHVLMVDNIGFDILDASLLLDVVDSYDAELAVLCIRRRCGDVLES